MSGYTFSPICRGQLFVMVSRDKGGKKPLDSKFVHPYLIISDNAIIQKKCKIICMGITSMSNNYDEDAIPVLCSNDSISYIRPSMEYEFDYSEFNMNNYKGTLIDDVITANEFLDMITNLRIYNKYGLCACSDKDIVEKSRLYKEKFKEMHSDKKELRELKKNTRSSINSKNNDANVKRRPTNNGRRDGYVRKNNENNLDKFTGIAVYLPHTKNMTDAQIIQFIKTSRVKDDEYMMKMYDIKSISGLKYRKNAVINESNKRKLVVY